MIIGMDQGSLANGELVRLFVAVGQGTGSPAVKLSNLIGTTAAGDPVLIRGTSATIPIDRSTPGGAFLQHSLHRTTVLVRVAHVADPQRVVTVGRAVARCLSL